MASHESASSCVKALLPVLCVVKKNVTLLVLMGQSVKKTHKKTGSESPFLSLLAVAADLNRQSLVVAVRHRPLSGTVPVVLPTVPNDCS